MGLQKIGVVLLSACLAGVTRQQRGSVTCWLQLGFALSRSAVVLSDSDCAFELKWHRSLVQNVPVVFCDLLCSLYYFFTSQGAQ